MITPKELDDIKRMIRATRDPSALMVMNTSTVRDLIAMSENAQETPKPKTVIGEIFERLRNHQGAEGSLHEQIYVDRLCMALAEAVEGLRMIHCGDQKGSVGKHDVFLSALSILKGEKTRDIPKA